MSEKTEKQKELSKALNKKFDKQFDDSGPGAKWINALLPKRREDRGDLVGGIAMWAFAALLFCLVFGGSHLALGGTAENPKFLLAIPAINWELLIGLLTPIVSHVVKGSIEVKKQ